MPKRKADDDTRKRRQREMELQNDISQAIDRINIQNGYFGNYSEDSLLHQINNQLKPVYSGQFIQVIILYNLMVV